MLAKRYGGEPARVDAEPLIRNGRRNRLIEREICKVGKRVRHRFQIKQFSQIPDCHSERQLPLGAAQGPSDGLFRIERRLMEGQRAFKVAGGQRIADIGMTRHQQAQMRRMPICAVKGVVQLVAR